MVKQKFSEIPYSCNCFVNVKLFGLRVYGNLFPKFGRALAHIGKPRLRRSGSRRMPIEESQDQLGFDMFLKTSETVE